MKSPDGKKDFHFLFGELAFDSTLPSFNVVQDFSEDKHSDQASRRTWDNSILQCALLAQVSRKRTKEISRKINL